MSDKLTRRSFLAVSTATAMTGLAPRVNAAEVVPGKKSPNEALRIAGIGVGGKGTGDIMACRRENIVALCDPDAERAREAFERLPDAKRYTDYREMLEAENLDAVTISTPDHSHAPAAYFAMMKGLHCFVQKPLTQTVAEARLLTNLAREKGVVTQMGNQGHCRDGVRELCEIFWDGAIGDVREVHIWTNRPIWPQGIENALEERPVPDTMDWDVWLGPAPLRPYNPGYAPFSWRGWWDFGAGALGDMGCHIMDPANWALKLNDAPTFTVELVEQEGNTEQAFPNKSIVKYSFDARGDMPPVDLYWYDGGLLPNHPEDIPADVTLGEGDNGSLFVGEKGYLTCATYGEEVRLLPADRFADYKKPEPYIERIRAQNPHLNWLDGIHGRVPEPASNFNYAGPFTEMVVLGNACLKVDGQLRFDRETMRVTNKPEANQWLSKTYREGWEIPVPEIG